MDSDLIEKARKIIQRSAQHPLPLNERVEAAIALAALMLTEAQATQTSQEKKLQSQLSRMMNDSAGKTFTTSLTDQCFRSNQPSRIANQLVYLIDRYGVPTYLSKITRLHLTEFKYLGESLAFALVPLTKHLIRQETNEPLRNALSQYGCPSVARPVLANGRIELLNYLREKCISADYHRYGSLGLRENEQRCPIKDEFP